MNDLTLAELNTLLAVFSRAGEITDPDEQALLERIRQSQIEKEELENMDFDDCLGGACKL